MEANEIMMNEEMTEVVEAAAEEIATKGSGFGIKCFAAGGVTALGIGLIAQFVVKPLWAKHKAKKQDDGVIDGQFTEVDDDNDPEEETEESEK